MEAQCNSGFGQEALESGLREVVIGGEGLDESIFLHDYKRQAIGEAPFFVGALAEKIDCPIQLDACGLANAKLRMTGVKFIPNRKRD